MNMIDLFMTLQDFIENVISAKGYGSFLAGRYGYDRVISDPEASFFLPLRFKQKTLHQF